MVAISDTATDDPEAARTRRYAASVLVLCFTFALLGRGMTDAFTVFLLPITKTFGWDRAEVVSIYAMATLTMGLTAPIVGRFFDRFGPRAVYASGLLLIGAGFSLAAYADRLWQLQLCIGLTAGFGASCLGTVTNSLLLGRWFGPKLPTAMAVVYSAMGAGILTIVPLMQILINHFGWQGAYRISGAVMLVLVVPLMILPWRRLAAGTSHGLAPAKTAAATLTDEGWTLLRALRHYAFWALFGTFFFTALGMYAISVQIVAYLVEAGFTPLQAATAWGFSGVVLLAGMLTVSWLDGLIGRRRALMLSYGFTTLGIAMLWLLEKFPNVWLLAGFVICFGSTLGSRGPLITAASLSYFRGQRVGVIFGSISIGSGVGSAVGAWCGGLLHDLTHGYDAVLAFAFVSAVLGLISFLVAPEGRD